MGFLTSRRPMNRLVIIGFCLLIAASVFSYAVRHQFVPENNFTDLVQGLLYGVCIATLLVGARRSRDCRT